MSGCIVLGNGKAFYNPSIMRRGRSDELSPLGAGGRNSYVYCAGDPVNFVDPSGQIFKKTKSWYRHRGLDSAMRDLRVNPDQKLKIKFAIEEIGRHPNSSMVDISTHIPNQYLSVAGRTPWHQGETRNFGLFDQYTLTVYTTHTVDPPPYTPPPPYDPKTMPRPKARLESTPEIPPPLDIQRFRQGN
ncbi:hypothetical protein D3C76_1234960 [compost metagenome]